MLKPSANSSMFVSSVMAKRREIRRSTNQILGCLKKLRGTCVKRLEPPDPFVPPPGVALEAKPNEVGFIERVRLPVKRAREKALKRGAIVQPFRGALPTFLSPT